MWTRHSWSVQQESLSHQRKRRVPKGALAGVDRIDWLIRAYGGDRCDLKDQAEAGLGECVASCGQPDGTSSVDGVA